MTRGNQRELARAKNAKKQAGKTGKGAAAQAQDGNKGMTLEARKQRDAEMMRLKQQKAETKDGGKGAKD